MFQVEVTGEDESIHHRSCGLIAKVNKSLDLTLDDLLREALAAKKENRQSPRTPPVAGVRNRLVGHVVKEVTVGPTIIWHGKTLVTL